MTSTHTIAIRPAAADEAADVRRLAYLDSQRPLRGDALIALADDVPVAAISLADGRVVADLEGPSEERILRGMKDAARA